MDPLNYSSLQAHHFAKIEVMVVELLVGTFIFVHKSSLVGNETLLKFWKFGSLDLCEGSVRCLERAIMDLKIKRGVLVIPQRD